MSAHVLLNLSHKLGKRDKMRGLPILLHGVISLPDVTSYDNDKLIYPYQMLLCFCQLRCRVLFTKVKLRNKKINFFILPTTYVLVER